EKGFLPIIFDFERATERDFTETIKILAGMALFVITDISNPRSNPLELQATVPDYMVPFVPILQKGEEPFAMFVDLQRKYRWVMCSYTTQRKRSSNAWNAKSSNQLCTNTMSYLLSRTKPSEFAILTSSNETKTAH